MIGKMIRKMRGMYHQSFLYTLINPLKCQVYCVGTAKSGTKSINAVFQDKLRTAHEPDSGRVIDTILDFANGSIKREEIKKKIGIQTR